MNEDGYSPLSPEQEAFHSIKSVASKAAPHDEDDSATTKDEPDSTMLLYLSVLAVCNEVRPSTSMLLQYCMMMCCANNPPNIFYLAINHNS